MAKNRLLLYAPVMHNVTAEMGKSYVRKVESVGLSAKKMDAYSDSLFENIENELNGYEIDKVYVDSMWEGGESALDEIRSSGKHGSYMCRIILGIVEKGARLMKTESMPLLAKAVDYDDKTTAEYKKTVKLLMRMKTGKVTEEQAVVTAKDITEVLKSIEKLDRPATEERDRYISRRIGMTLKEGETAVLFMGASHRPAFGSSIEVRYLMDQRKLKVECDEKFRKKAVKTLLGRFLAASKNVREK